MEGAQARAVEVLTEGVFGAFPNTAYFVMDFGSHLHTAVSAAGCTIKVSKQTTGLVFTF